jgi:TonB family protein
MVRAENLPDMRPALIGDGPKSLINLIDTQVLRKKGLGDAAVMFSGMILPDGSCQRSRTYRWTPGGEPLEREVFRQTVKARYIPAVHNHKHVEALLYGTVLYRVIDGRPRLRIYLNQEKSELAEGHDFIAPQPYVEPNFRGHIEYPNAAGIHHVAGEAVLSLTVDATGHLKNVNVDSEYPAGYDFGKAALKAFKDYTFLPAYRNGKPVDATTKLTVYFTVR